MHTRIISVFLAALIVCCSAFGSTALAQDKVETSEVKSAAAEDSAQNGTASAAKTKEEVIYASLKADGSVGSVYAVNIINGGGEFEDYGSYSAVRNMTGTEQLLYENGVVSGSSEQQRLYYEGQMESAELPWNIKIDYFLDGESVTSEQLGGADGGLEIKIGITKNEGIEKNFFDDYALQVTVPLDTERCQNIKADGATIANAGSVKQLTYTLLPGSGGSFSITADVTDFYMDAITLNGIKMELNLDIDTSSFKNQLKTLSDAVDSLSEGSSELKSGLEEIIKNAELYASGVEKLNLGIKELAGQTAEFADGLEQLKQGAGALAAQKDALVSGAESIVNGAFSSANAAVKMQVGSLWDLLVSSGVLPLSSDNFESSIDLLASFAPDQKETLEGLKNQLKGSIDYYNGIVKYTDAVGSLKEGTDRLAAGGDLLITALNDEILNGSQQIYDGAAGLNDGLNTLLNGYDEFNDGVERLDGETDRIPDKIEDEINRLMGALTGSDEVYSFTSENNKNVTSVQFVIKTDKIQNNEVEKQPEQPEKQPGFWQKFLRLFGIGD